jgi:Flp pilus assembly protein CpaB
MPFCRCSRPQRKTVWGRVGGPAREWIAGHAIPPSTQNGTVVVAAVPLGFGTALNRENVTEIPWASGKTLLDEGKRAVTVRVDDVRGVAGFVLPGDRVDVVLIRSVPGSSGSTENFGCAVAASTSSPTGARRHQPSPGR